MADAGSLKAEAQPGWGPFFPTLDRAFLPRHTSTARARLPTSEQK